MAEERLRKGAEAPSLASRLSSRQATDGSASRDVDEYVIENIANVEVSDHLIVFGRRYNAKFAGGCFRLFG